MGTVAIGDDALTLRAICLCAEWCGSCREYRSGFEALAKEFPEVSFAWLDIEDEGDEIGDLDIENFPTLLIHRGASILFYGPMLPLHEHLRRLIVSLCAMSAEESCEYVLTNAERRAWQDNADLQHLCRVRTHTR